MRRWAAGCRVLAAFVGFAAALTSAAPPARDDPHKLERLESDINRLRAEREELQDKERGLLGDLAKLDADLALATAQHEAAKLRLADARLRLDTMSRSLRDLEDAQHRRAPYLAARLREIYKRGPLGLLNEALSTTSRAESLEGVRYATYLSRRDASQLAAWRETASRLTEERTALSGETERLVALEQESGRSERALAASRATRAGLLGRIRGDREQHDRALGELESAARGLGRIVDSIGGAPAGPALDVRSFRGLLDWPAAGPVTAGFGRSIHPKFRTEVPHPGLDIDAPEGDPIRAVFDGTVAFAATLHGYGLTVIIDHGRGLLSVYAHASVALVEAGQAVTRGQDLGRVGDSGSLRGPYLYFELRDGGKPVDPVPWLRRR